MREFVLYYKVSDEGTSQTHLFKAESDEDAIKRSREFIESRNQDFPKIKAGSLFRKIPLE